jgi:maleylpyruvate isomerase
VTEAFALHGYFRSTASYRVRIALNLKGIAYRDVFHHLRKGEQRAPAYLKHNPQGLVPTLDVGGLALTQSLAICEYLDEIFPDPALLPGDAWNRARIRSLAQIIACDIHPIQNLKVLGRLRSLGLNEDAVTAWAGGVIDEGLAAFNASLVGDGPFCAGESVTLADLCLVPQLVNARRFGVDIRWPRLLEIERNCLAIEAFDRARPENQADAE